MAKTKNDHKIKNHAASITPDSAHGGPRDGAQLERPLRAKTYFLPFFALSWRWGHMAKTKNYPK
jgi:hypothetical protein